MKVGEPSEVGLNGVGARWVKGSEGGGSLVSWGEVKVSQGGRGVGDSRRCGDAYFALLLLAVCPELSLGRI